MPPGQLPLRGGFIYAVHMQYSLFAHFRFISKNTSLFEGHFICRRLWRKQTDEMPKVGTPQA